MQPALQLSAQLSVQLIASATIPLIVGLLNLLVGGYALVSGLRAAGRSRLLFALGPLGVGIWAVAWFSSVFNRDVLVAMRVLGSIGGIMAVLGFAVDGLLEMRRRTLAVFLFAAFMTLGLLGLYLLPWLHLSFPIVARLIALGGVVVVVTARLEKINDADEKERLLARRSILAVVTAGMGFIGLTLLALMGVRAPSDPLLFAVLLAEIFTLLYITGGRIDVHSLLSRAVTYSILSVAVAAVAAIAYRVLGYELDLVAITLTVAIALLTSALFMGLSDRLTRFVESMIFPEHAKTKEALIASRGEAQALRRRLERAEKLAITGELAASVAHEIKNPLSPIRGYAQLLGGRLSAVSDAQRAVFEKGLRIIKEETDRIDHRVQELLKIARADRDKPSIDGDFKLNQIVLEASAVAEGEPGIKAIEHQLDPAVDRVRGDEEEMRSALLNLLKNAAEAMADQGAGNVQISSKRNGTQAIIEVKDEGPGLSQEQADQVFAAFYTTKSGGTGLGLAIARSAVDAAGGHIQMMPRADRTGATVRISLLLAEGGPEPDDEGQPARSLDERRE